MTVDAPVRADREPDADRELDADADADSGEQAPGIGRTELGTVSINDRVVGKIASRAAVEVSDAGAAAPRILGRSVGGGHTLGLRETDLTALPKASADVDGSIVVLHLQISVRWPASVPKVTAAVRDRVTARIEELTGLNVTEVSISVTDLATNLAPPPRVR